MFASQNALRYIMRDQAVDWVNALWMEALYWVPWLVLTPVLLATARRKPLGSGAPRSNVWWHLGCHGRAVARAGRQPPMRCSIRWRSRMA